MMVLSWGAPYFTNPSLLQQLLTVILTVTLPSESAAQTELRGEIGQNVTISCPVERQNTIKFFYLQKDEVFVNGFYTSRTIPKEKWPNTRVVHGKATVQMLHLKASHDGDYECHIQYNGSENVSSIVIHLSVTAKYSKPNVTMSCDDNICLVTCASHGGYPRAELMWNGVGDGSSPAWKVLNVSEESDPDTMLYNTSSTSSFNCSYGAKRLINCSVGGVASDMLPVCVPKDPPDIYILIVIGICSLLGLIALIPLLLRWKHKKEQTRAGDPKEAIPLN
ncbi:CD276 antigen isoform X2 [Dunckerocampus dactyliophorus]|nr:CD276 antigen isoform X2 [Dunckerocampus dactyliophorus]